MAVPPLPLPTPGQNDWAGPLNDSLELLNQGIGGVNDAATAAENARDEAVLAAQAAEAVGATNDAIMTSVAQDPGSDFSIELDERFATKGDLSAYAAPSAVVTGDGIDPTGAVDSTLAIQAILDSVATGTVVFPPGTYKVSKNPALSYAGGDEPCLRISGKTGFTVFAYGAEFLVSAHGQGVIDLAQSTDVKILGATFSAPGIFPPLDGTTGRGEKHDGVNGYYNAVLDSWVRNNSIDTSAFSTGGYGGAFPQLEGGTASTWGHWTGGGFIGNFGDAITIGDGCSRILIQDNFISGFNGIGVAIAGLPGAACENIDVIGNTIRNIYSSGVLVANTCDSSRVLIEGNLIEHIGHPDAIRSDLNSDPGYGVAIGRFKNPSDIQILRNRIVDTKRKGVDAHSGRRLLIQGNYIETSTSAVMLSGSDATSVIEDTHVVGNVIRDVVPLTGHSNWGVIFVGNGVTPTTSEHSIRDNIILDSGHTEDQVAFNGYVATGLINVRDVGYMDVSGNYMRTGNRLVAAGIAASYAGNGAIGSLDVRGNTVRGNVKTGILLGGTRTTPPLVNDNAVYLSDSAQIPGTGIVGISGGASAPLARLQGNKISVPASATRVSTAVENERTVVNVIATSGGNSVTVGHGFANGLSLTLTSQTYGFSISGLPAVQSLTVTPASPPPKRRSDGAQVLHFVVLGLSSGVQVQVVGIDGANVPLADLDAILTLTLYR